MDEGEGETDGEASELAVFVTAVGNAKDDHQEDEGQEGFNQEGTTAADGLIVATASSLEVFAKTVRSENGSSTSASSIPDAKQDSASDDSANELGNPVNEHFLKTHAAIDENAKADSRIKVST